MLKIAVDDDPFGLPEAVLATRAELDAERALRQHLEDQNERLRRKRSSDRTLPRVSACG